MRVKIRSVGAARGSFALRTCWRTNLTIAERGCTVSPDLRLGTLAEVVDHLGRPGTGTIDGTEIRGRRPAVGHKDRDRFISGKSKQNAVKTVFTDGGGRMLSCKPDQARVLGPLLSTAIDYPGPEGGCGTAPSSAARPGPGIHGSSLPFLLFIQFAPASSFHRAAPVADRKAGPSPVTFGLPLIL